VGLAVRYSASGFGLRCVTVHRSWGYGAMGLGLQCGWGWGSQYLHVFPLLVLQLWQTASIQHLINQPVMLHQAPPLRHALRYLNGVKMGFIGVNWGLHQNRWRINEEKKRNPKPNLKEEKTWQPTDEMKLEPSERTSRKWPTLLSRVSSITSWG